MKVSVVTIVKNGMPFILETISSVLSQDYKNLEYIVIDGGSTDGTIEALEGSELKITSWVSESDKGIADAFNKGLAKTTGDYIMFLNADDKLVSESSISQIVSQIVENKLPTFIYGDCNVLNRDTGCKLYTASIQFEISKIQKGLMPPHPSMFVKKEYFNKYGVFDSSFRIAMDFEWFIRGIRNETIVHAPVLVTDVRDGGVSTQNQKKVIAEIVSALKKNGYIKYYYNYLIIKTYFFSRYILKSAFIKVGVYDIYNYFKIKLNDFLKK